MSTLGNPLFEEIGRIVRSAKVPSPLEQRIQSLESRIRDLCELAEDGLISVHGEDATKFYRMLMELGEDAGFDLEKHRQDGFDRGDA
jgi:predicted transcriptional regulator with HTH domain